MNDENEDVDVLAQKPYTVSAVYDDGLEALIKHCMAADAQAARDGVIMDTGGRVIIASVFDGHLSEPDSIVLHASQVSEPDEEEAAGMCM
ncbi:MAG: hypothetical protein ACR2LZ_12685 [Pyrinomonadaceae bacterium]